MVEGSFLRTLSTLHLKPRARDKLNSIEEWQCFSPKMALFRNQNHTIGKSQKYLLSNFPSGVSVNVTCCAEAPSDICKQNQPPTSWWQPSKSLF